MLPQIAHRLPPTIPPFDQASLEDLHRNHADLSSFPKRSPSVLQQPSAQLSPAPLSQNQHPFPLCHSRPSQPSQRIEDRVGIASKAIPQSYNFAEHMLRRKTPNGTLAAGYDGTPVHRSTKPPASKHIILPLSTTPRAGMSSSGNQYFESMNIASSHGQNASIFNGPLPSSARFRYNGVMQGMQGPINITLGEYGRISSAPETSNSILEQIPVYQGSPPAMYDGMQVPTVLQPVYHPSVGPTASNDPGFYGPYWPDGTFEPYRPAATRALSHQTTSSTVYHHLQGSMQQLHRVTLPQGAGEYAGTSLSNARQDYSTPVSFTNQISISKRDNSITLGANPFLYDPTTQPSFFQHQDSVSSPLPNNNRNIQFKEKVIVWAHGVYVELLTHFHHSKRKNNHMKHSEGAGKPYSQGNIYPRPPRQPAYDFSVSDQLDASEQERRSQIEHNERAHTTRMGLQSSAFPRESRGFRSVSEYTDIQSLGQDQSYNEQVNSSYSDRHTGMSPANSVVFGLHQRNVIDKARTALEMLSTLCRESNWMWVDGMLVGGCLAYGLEDYTTALDWFTKIVLIDHSHVEAMSNLAATLLSLNRKEEAEQYWLQSIKLRPNYFEAVEHLIGLLCSNHRGNDAIRIIQFVESSLRIDDGKTEGMSDMSSEDERALSESTYMSSEQNPFDLDKDAVFKDAHESYVEQQPGFGSSGFSIPGSENGRILALVHAKGNLLYSLGDISAASRAFEEAVLIGTGRNMPDIQALIHKILHVLSNNHGYPIEEPASAMSNMATSVSTPLLLPPDRALRTASLVFARDGQLPGLRYVSEGAMKNAAISTTSNSLLSLAKIFQDGMATSSRALDSSHRPSGVDDILALYYLSLSLQPSPSTANNVGILLASVQQPVSPRVPHRAVKPLLPAIPGVIPGSGVALALSYYNYGLNLDSHHAHLYTNLGSLLKDIGQLAAAIKMYEQAVACDSTFDIALANLANAVKDQGRISDAIEYYKRAVAASPDFAEAVCGLANALNSVCDWTGRGGVVLERGKYDRWHVNNDGMLCDGKSSASSSGWMQRVVKIVSKQLEEGASWGRGILTEQAFSTLLRQLEKADSHCPWSEEKFNSLQSRLSSWIGKPWEGSRLVRLIERAMKRSMHRWYIDNYIEGKRLSHTNYVRPQLPGILPVPVAPTVLPFHTFTCPLSAKEIRMISQRNALKITYSTLRAPWLPNSVYPPPPPPNPILNIGYVSSDFNNHPLAHLMQSVFGFHNPSKVKAFCYATTVSDNSSHRLQIEREAPVFRDVSGWSSDRLVKQIVQDQIHILVNLNGYTRGARNEIFAARPSPIQMSFMGFAGTLGAEWCDYLLADEIAVPPETLRPWRRNIEIEDQLRDDSSDDEEHWVYSENIIFFRDTFFCCDHRQSSQDSQLPWNQEQKKRWRMRKDIFPNLSDDAIILGNFNQLYKIDPTTFRTWLRILSKVPKAILWLLRFPDLGESNLKRTARLWAGEEVASRIWFTDVAPKNQHISRARVCDLFLDTPECNAHTTAADILWSATPLLTLPRYKYKMCSRMAASILQGALPRSAEGRRAASDLISKDDDEYEKCAVRLASGLAYDCFGVGTGRLMEIRRLLYENRWSCALFDTKRWVSDLETAYDEAWRRWVAGIGGDIYL